MWCFWNRVQFWSIITDIPDYIQNTKTQFSSSVNNILFYFIQLYSTCSLLPYSTWDTSKGVTGMWKYWFWSSSRFNKSFEFFLWNRCLLSAVLKMVFTTVKLRIKLFGKCNSEDLTWIEEWLYARQKKSHRCIEQILDSVGEGEGGMIWENIIETCILSIVKHITSPGWMHETSAQGWGTGMTQRDGMGREVEVGFRMGNTCKSMTDLYQCMAKTTTIL